MPPSRAYPSKRPYAYEFNRPLFWSGLAANGPYFAKSAPAMRYWMRPVRNLHSRQFTKVTRLVLL